MPRLISQEIKTLICEDLRNLSISIKDIMIKYNVSQGTISKIRTLNDIPMRKGSVFNYKHYLKNENYFDIIDTPDKAYFLGFITGDAYIKYRSSSNSFTLRLELHNKDKKILEDFVRYLDCSYEVVSRLRIDQKSQKVRDRCYLEISRLKLIEGLMKHGVGPNKSKELNMPTTISDDLMCHYIRGLIDSDGCWCLRKDKNDIIFSFVSSVKSFTLEIQKFLMKKCQLNEVKLNEVDNASVIYYGGNQQCKRIYDYLYSNGGPWLERKYKLTTDYFKSINLISYEENEIHIVRKVRKLEYKEKPIKSKTSFLDLVIKKQKQLDKLVSS